MSLYPHDDASNPWASSSRTASSDSLHQAFAQSLDKRRENGTREPASSKTSHDPGSSIEAYQIEEDDDDHDITINGRQDDGLQDVLSPEGYQSQMQEALGSDEDILENGGANGLRSDDADREASKLGIWSQSELPDESDEVQLRRPVAHPLQNPDLSVLTEEANSSISSLSLRPSRPWQFPTPRRLRALRMGNGQGELGNSSTSIQSLSAIADSPSIADSGDRLGPQMPYGDALAARDAPLTLKGLEDDHDGHADAAPRSFLRLSRLCGLSDREGNPTVLAVASGIVAVGTKQGKVGLFNRARGWIGAIAVDACITSLAISHDKTFVAIGTTKGHIFLYDVAKLHTPARHVPPVSALLVKSGRGEGHQPDAKIVHLSFVGSRRTAVVSADEQGLSFYHSLGKILGVSSNDTLRILGRYPSVLNVQLNVQEHVKKSTILAMSALPIGPAAHQSDANNLIALLTPSKLVLVGLKPAPRTWFRKSSPAKSLCRSGALAWLPSSQTDRGVSPPTLAFAFEDHLYFLQLVIRQSELQVQILAPYKHDRPILSLQWLSRDCLAMYSPDEASLYDTRRARCTERQAFPRPISIDWLSESAGDAFLASACGSFQAHKGHLLALTDREIISASLITWADRILALVSNGDPLGAIHLATTYFQEPNSGGSRIGLPASHQEQRPIISDRIQELMRATTAYVFSENRMKDDMIHYENGVDRTPLFEGLARVCAQACIARDDFAFLFDELYDVYSDNGIEAIFADQMEDFIVTGKLRILPIPIVKRLIHFRKAQGRHDLAEIIIRNVDPSCLDLDQALHLCLEHGLYDALIYVYMSAMHDFVGPVVELLPLARQGREDAYRIFSYLSLALIGLDYPGQSPLGADEASEARSSICSFLFSGRCTMWPPGPGGRLVLTQDGAEEEPTFPYLRLLLTFDAEAFLDALDIAFEDTWLDEAAFWTRQRIVNLLMDLEDLSHDAKVFTQIFIARNSPKYPQFVKLTPAQVDMLLQDLASTLLEDEETKEDREYAVECLLSAYHPQHTSDLLDAFERAGFYDILRRVYRSEKRWAKLASLLVTQPTVNQFQDLDDVLRKSRGDAQTSAAVLQAIPRLVDEDVPSTATLIERYYPLQVLDAIGTLDRSPHRQLAILDALVNGSFSPRIESDTRNQYVSLLCSIRPADVVGVLDRMDRDYFDYNEVERIAGSEDVHDARILALDCLARPDDALAVFDDLLNETALVLRAEDDSDASYDNDGVHARESLVAASRMATRMCSEHSDENLWVQLLSSLVRLARDTRTSISALNLSRTLLQDALSAFVTSTGSETTSFGPLLRYLTPGQGQSYAEVRDVTEAMMGAYRVRQDVLGITNRLLDRDVFSALHKLTKRRRRGWRPQSGAAVCHKCKQVCFGSRQGAKPRGEMHRSMEQSASAASLGAGPHSLMRSPSFLEPAFSPRPDKGKAVARWGVPVDEEGGSANNRDASGREDRTEGAFLDVSETSELSASTPAELFMSSQFGSHDDADIAEEETEERSNKGHLIGADADEEDTESVDESVVVRYDGTVYHRRCAPQQGPEESNGIHEHVE